VAARGVDRRAHIPLVFGIAGNGVSRIIETAELHAAAKAARWISFLEM
jgi:hypothetical protein